VDKNSADFTSSGRSFHIRGLTIGKAWGLGKTRQIDCRHCKMVSASKTERLVTMQVGNKVEWTKLLQLIDANSLFKTG